MRSFFFSFFNKHWSRDNPSEWLECFLWLVQIWGWSKIQPQKDDWITCRTVSEDKTVRRQRLQWRDQTSLCHSLTYVKNLHFIPKQQQCYKTTIIFVQFCKRPELRILLLWKKKISSVKSCTFCSLANPVIRKWNTDNNQISEELYRNYVLL